MNPDPSTGIHRDLFAPTLLRALVALVFGAVTVFWQEPTLPVVAWGVGLYLVLTGAASVLLQLRLNGNDHVDMGPTRQIPQSYGVLYLLGGVFTILGADTPAWLVVYAASIMGLAGLTELALGLSSARPSRWAATGPSPDSSRSSQPRASCSWWTSAPRRSSGWWGPPRRRRRLRRHRCRPGGRRPAGRPGGPGPGALGDRARLRSLD